MDKYQVYQCQSQAQIMITLLQNGTTILKSHDNFFIIYYLPLATDALYLKVQFNSAKCKKNTRKIHSWQNTTIMQNVMVQTWTSLIEALPQTEVDSEDTVPYKSIAPDLDSCIILI